MLALPLLRGRVPCAFPCAFEDIIVKIAASHPIRLATMAPIVPCSLSTVKTDKILAVSVEATLSITKPAAYMVDSATGRSMEKPSF